MRNISSHFHVRKWKLLCKLLRVSRVSAIFRTVKFWGREMTVWGCGIPVKMGVVHKPRPSMKFRRTEDHIIWDIIY